MPALLVRTEWVISAYGVPFQGISSTLAVLLRDECHPRVREIHMRTYCAKLICRASEYETVLCIIAMSCQRVRIVVRLYSETRSLLYEIRSCFA